MMPLPRYGLGSLTLTTSRTVRIRRLDALDSIALLSSAGEVAELSIPSKMKHMVSTKLSLILRLKLDGTASFSPVRLATLRADATTRVWRVSTSERYRLDTDADARCQSSSS